MNLSNIAELNAFLIPNPIRAGITRQFSGKRVRRPSGHTHNEVVECRLPFYCWSRIPGQKQRNKRLRGFHVAIMSGGKLVVIPTLMTCPFPESFEYRARRIVLADSSYERLRECRGRIRW